MERTALIIDDDQKLRKLLKDYLGGYGYTVHTLPDGREACDAVRRIGPDIVILDIMMPGPDGTEVLGAIRRESDVPVIMLTAKGDDSERIVGLELGADDYVPKPFNPRELLARMKAVLRRIEPREPRPAPEASHHLEVAGLKLDTSRKLLCVGETQVVLPPTECRLLEEFMRFPDQPLSRDDLMDRVWGREFVAYDRSIDVYISKLRQALKPHAGHADRIQTVWGTGYLFRSGQ